MVPLPCGEPGASSGSRSSPVTVTSTFCGPPQTDEQSAVEPPLPWTVTLAGNTPEMS